MLLSINARKMGNTKDRDCVHESCGRCLERVGEEGPLHLGEVWRKCGPATGNEEGKPRGRNIWDKHGDSKRIGRDIEKGNS